MSKEKQPVSSENSPQGKLEKRFQKLLSQTKEQWQDLDGWKVLAGTGIASSLVGLGFALWWLRGKMKNKETKEKIDQVAKEELSDSEELTKHLGEQAVLAVASEVARRLEEIKGGKKILLWLRRGGRFLGFPLGEDTMEGHLVSAATAAAAAGEQAEAQAEPKNKL